MIIRVVEAKARVRGVAGTYRVVLQGVRGASATDFFLGKFALKRLKIALKAVKIYRISLLVELTRHLSHVPVNCVMYVVLHYINGGTRRLSAKNRSGLFPQFEFYPF